MSEEQMNEAPTAEQIEYAALKAAQTDTQEKAKRAQEIATKVANTVGPLLNELLPSDCGAVVVLTFDNRADNLSIISPHDDMVRASILSHAVAGLNNNLLMQYQQFKQLAQMEEALAEAEKNGAQDNVVAN